MKALQTRSPIHIYHNVIGLATVNFSLYVNDDPTAFDTTQTPDYSLTSSAINNEVIVEVSELIRSENQYLFNSDFYERRDTATYALIVSELVSNVGTTIRKEYNFLRIRDGYVSRVENTQIINNLVSQDLNDWTLDNATLTENVNDSFGGSDAVTLDNNPDGVRGFLQFDLNNGLSTVSVIAKSSDSILRLATIGGLVEFDIINDVVVTQTSGLILATDIIDLGNNFKLVSATFNEIDTYIRILTDDVADSSLNLLAPKIIKGNWLNNNASDLILQDNTTIYSDSVIVPKISFDKKEANTTYFYENVGGIGAQLATDITLQSANFDVSSNDLIYDQLDGTVTTQAITLSEICEPK